MKFVDEATLIVESGRGGNGCLSFRREKFIPRGGPDGGDGGKGGDVILQTSGRRTLVHFRFQHLFRAKNGRPGQGRQKTGRGGEDLIIEVPVGTVVRDFETNEVLVDLDKPGETWLAARGGRGGKGNKHFASSTHKAPKFAQPGEEGQERKFRLELKLLADVGIAGLPNAGKSTLISVITAAKPAVGDYPFTTITPNLGVVENPYGEPFVVADIPGLIEGAHQGAGLGTQFLRHIERTRILVHLIDASLIDPEKPLEAWETVNNELKAHDSELAKKPQIVVLNKMDLPGALENAEKFQEKCTGLKIIRISAATTKGTKKVVQTLAKKLADIREMDDQDPENGTTPDI